MTLIFSIHYFLWYGALTSIFGYESVYARYYTNATPMQYGYLNMVLPFMTVIVTPVICSLADRQRSHRSYFTLSLVLTTISICLYSMLPLFTDQHQPSTDRLLLGPWIYYCINSLICDLSMGINTCLSDSFAVLQAEEHGTSFGHIIVWGTFGWASTALILSLINQSTVLPRLIPGLIFGSVLLTIDVIIVSFWPYAADFKLDIIPISAAQTLTGSASSAHRDPSDYQPSNELARINLGTEFDTDSGNPQMNTKSPIQLATINDMSESTQVKGLGLTDTTSELDSSLKTINSDFVSSIDDHSSSKVSPYNSMLSGLTNKNQIRTAPRDYQSIRLKNLRPSTTNQSGPPKVGAADNEPLGKRNTRNTRRATSFRMQLVLLGLIMRRRKSLIRYLILFILSGFFMSMQWNYFFLYLEEIYYNKFELISALSMVGQSILGELPFFILSRKVIDYFGRSRTLSISVISIGLRFLLYAYLLPNVNMYCIVIADCFQGPNYGLFYVVMTEVGLEYSFCDEETIERLVARGDLDRNNKPQVDSLRLSLRSTVQSVAFACYEGIGVGLGSIAGGWIVASYGFKALWLSMAICSISVGVMNLLIEFACREHDPELDASEQREFMYANRMGTIEKLASPAPLPSATNSKKATNRQPREVAPTPTASAKIQKVLVRKSAGSRVAPPVAALAKQGD